MRPPGKHLYRKAYGVVTCHSAKAPSHVAYSCDAWGHRYEPEAEGNGIPESLTSLPDHPNQSSGLSRWQLHRFSLKCGQTETKSTPVSLGLFESICVSFNPVRTTKSSSNSQSEDSVLNIGK